MGFFLADIVNVYLQNSLRIAKENLITPALILNNVANMVIVKPWSSLVGRLVPVAKSKCFHDFLYLFLKYVDSGNSKRLNSKQSLISKHFWWNWAIIL